MNLICINCDTPGAGRQCNICGWKLKLTTTEKCLRLGYDRKIFDSSYKGEFIFNSETYRSFVEDSIDFVVTVNQKRDRFNLIRKTKDIHLRA